MTSSNAKSPWVPHTHPSPLVAEQYRLGGYSIVRMTGQGSYSLFGPASSIPLLTGTLGQLQEAGALTYAVAVQEQLQKAQAEVQEDAKVAQADVVISDQGSIVLFRPRSQEAKDWIEENVDPEAMWFGHALVVEHRFASYLIEGMAEAGLALTS